MSDVDDAEDVPEYDNNDPTGDRAPYINDNDPEWQAVRDLFEGEEP
jgi:hypothetical protein